MENFNNQSNQQIGTNTVNQPYNQPYPPPLPPEKAEENRFKRWMYKIFGGALLYDGIMIAVTMAIIVVVTVGVMVVQMVMGKPESFYDDFMAWFENTDMGSSIAVFIAVFFLALYMRKTVKFKEIFVKQKSMNFKSFFIIFCVFYGCQLVFGLADMGVEALLNLIGLTAQKAVESASSGSSTISMMFYAGFVAPVFEEVVYRGYMMKSFEKTGLDKGYAVLISSVLFGVMHANIVQSPYAFVVGMVLGYTAIEYGIIWSILLHFLNNFVFGEGLTLIEEHTPENVGEIISIGISVIFFVLAVIFLIVKRKAVAEYVRENYKVQKKYYKWTFTNPLFIIFCVICIVMSFGTITKLE